MQNYEKAVRTRQKTYASAKLRVFEPLLLDLMNGGEITTNQIAEKYNLHRSTARSYREQLLKSGAIRLSQNVTKSNVAYEGSYVIADIAKAREFINTLQSGVNISSSQWARKTAQALLPGTRIVCARDDAEVPMRRMCNEKVEVVRHWLDVALFGHGPAPSLMSSEMAAV